MTSQMAFFFKVKALSTNVGEFIYAEPRSPDFEGNFARVRVRIDVTKPLKNAVSLVIRRRNLWRESSSESNMKDCRIGVQFMDS